jgi:four helix bundle protein
MHNFKNLKVWEKSMALAASVYKLMEAMPAEEKFGLTSQINRCAVSIPSNIAEGAGRNTNAGFARFLDISNGSSNELETQLLLAQQLNYLDANSVAAIADELDQIQKMNYKLMTKLREN